MGKRSDFPRVERDSYFTPYEAVKPLLPHLKPGTRFAEPCCGDGALMNHLERNGHVCEEWADIAPLCDDAVTRDARYTPYCAGSCFITNPPWSRGILHPLIDILSRLAPTWFLLDADWMHTKQSAPYMQLCRKIVSVGRVKWVPNSKMTGKDNAAWYLFDARGNGVTEFWGRSNDVTETMGTAPAANVISLFDI